MPQANDYAIVVGITAYPGLSANLQAPESDAAAIEGWLTDQEGGDLPPDNIWNIRKNYTEITPPKPTHERVRDAFIWLREKAEENIKAGNGWQVGRRIYIYMSGHGFSPGRKEGALYTTDARTFDPRHCYASKWLQHLQDNGYFEEYVLWMDCCMDRDFAVRPESTFIESGVPVPPGPTFVGLAARRPLKTVERAVADNDNVHGVFTWTLLQGLRGGAVDKDTGQINGRSLGDYLINGMKNYLSPSDLANPDISQEPEIESDARLIFGTTKPPARPDITLRLPDSCEGEEALLWSGSPPQSTSLKVANKTVSAKLDLGLHLIEVPTRNLRFGFEIGSIDDREIPIPAAEIAAGNGSVTVQIPPPGTKFLLEIQPRQPTAEIFIIDQQLKLARQGKGSFQEALEFGLYKVKLRIGRGTDEVIVLMDRNVSFVDADQSYNGQRVIQNPALALRLGRPQIVSAAPVYGNLRTHEYQVGAAENWFDPSIRPPSLFGTSYRPAPAELRLMARVWSQGGVSPGAEPWKNVSLTRNDGRELVRLADQPVEMPDYDPFVKARLEAIPGNYYLRQKLPDGREFEQSLIVCNGWALEVYLLSVSDRAADDDASADCPPLDRCTIRMRSPGQAGQSPEMEQVFESARLALVDDKSILNAELEDLLLHKFENPLAGILGAHLLIKEADRDPATAADRLAVLNEVVPNLRIFLGPDHPDVEAISLRCPAEALRTTAPIQSLPMFERSWRLMVEATEKNPRLVPESLWLRAHAMVKMGGYLAWARDQNSQESYIRDLKDEILEMKKRFGTSEATRLPTDLAARGGLASASSPTARESVPSTPEAVEPGVLIRRLAVPASALETLWNPSPP